MAVAALEKGETALAIRKGGIREKAFAVPEARFFFFKSYEHQKTDQLKPAYHHLLASLPKRRDDDPVILTSFAEVVAAHEVSDKTDLDALDPHHIWTPEYAGSRLKWRPKKPLTALVLRTFLLPDPIELPYQKDLYGGCKSWIELERRISIEGSRPALSGEEFERLVTPPLERLGRLSPAPVGS